MMKSYPSQSARLCPSNTHDAKHRIGLSAGLGQVHSRQRRQRGVEEALGSWHHSHIGTEAHHLSRHMPTMVTKVEDEVRVRNEGVQCVGERCLVVP